MTTAAQRHPKRAPIYCDSVGLNPNTADLSGIVSLLRARMRPSPNLQAVSNEQSSNRLPEVEQRPI